MTDFEQEKNSLHIDDFITQAMEHIGNKNYNVALNLLKPLALQFEHGKTLENTEDAEYYSFTDNIEFFTKLIENAHNQQTTNIVPLNPSYSRMYHLLGYLYTEAGDIEHAVISLEKALRWNPVSAGTYLEFAEIYKKSAQWDKFLPLAQNGLKYAKTAQTLARAFRGLGYCFCEQKNYELAVSLYMHSLQFEENREIVGAEVGYIYEQSGKTVGLPDPDKAVQVILENGFDVEMSNYVFAGYTKFLQALKEAGETQAYAYYEDALKKLVFSPDKVEYLKGI